MRLLCFFVLFIFAVSKSYADNITRDGRPATVNCNMSKEAARSILDEKLTPWSSDYIYPLLVCVTLKGTINSCDISERSRISMYFEFYPKTIIFDVVLGPQHFAGSKKRHCRLYHASEFAKKLKNRRITCFTYTLEALLDGTPEEGATKPIMQLSTRALSYDISEPTHDIKAMPSKDRTVHAVVCSFPNCVVVAEKYKATRTEFFSIIEGRTPQYEGQAGPVTTGMFSVTSFVCDPGKCPTKFSALNLADTKA